MKKIIINGSFLCRNLTGIERFSLEICKRLDSLDKNSLFELYVPKDAKFIPELSNLKITISDTDKADIRRLEDVKITLSKPRILSMLIWTTYFSKQLKALAASILGTEKVCGIYKITNIETDECYIGQAVDISSHTDVLFTL